jgi:hypothetical protein
MKLDAGKTKSPIELADQIENFFRLHECQRRDGKSPFELTVELLTEDFNVDAYRRPS